MEKKDEFLRNTPVFDRQDTKAIKGVAVILMLFHHLAGFPDRMPVGFTGFQSLWSGFVTGGYLEALALTANICVSFFFFLGGYGMYMRWKHSKLSLKETIFDLYTTYWKVFVIFIPIGILLFGRNGSDINELCTRYVFTGKADMLTTVLSDFIGWTCDLNSEWWFFKSYICVLPMGFLFCYCIRKNNNAWADLFFVFGIDILIRNIFPALTKTEIFSSLSGNLFYTSFCNINNYASTFFAGIVIAKYDGITQIKKKLQELPLGTFAALLVFFALWWCRTYVLGEIADIIYCVLMIPALSVVIDRIRVFKKCFVFLGEHSTNMWLIHSFYCYYFLEITQLVYCTKSVWIDLLILIALSLVSSVALNGLYRLIGKLFSKRTRATA